MNTKERQTAIRYAKGLFRLNHSTIPQKDRELQEIAALFMAYPSLLKLLSAPQIGLEQRKEIAVSCFKERIDPQLFSFLNLLLENGKIRNLPMIAKEYHHLVVEQQGKIEVEMIASQSISDEQREKLWRQLESFLKRDIELHQAIDPALLGGIVFILSNRMLDLSLRGRLARLKLHLYQTHNIAP